MTTIPESELILNARGAIYHLDLLPEEIANTVITVGDPHRVKEVSKYFDRVEITRQHREFVTHTGFIGNNRMSVISTGIGTDNIDIVVTELDALVNIDLQTRKIKENLTPMNIIRIGTSGALQADIEIDSFVASEFAIGMDNLLNFYHLEHPPFEKELLLGFLNHVQDNHIAFIPYVAGGSSSLISKFQGITHKGITVTCPGFYGPQGRMLRAEPAFPDLIDHLSSFTFSGHRITNFEMETSAIYGMSRLLGHQAVSLNAIVANRMQKKFSSDSHKAVDRLIRAALELLVEN
ncbi:MAG: nucleoside phosphorylase [Chitinophagaceae bacterium]|nr:nucleoside phosphorylase [Chitinophagaceae bacterium]